MFPASASADVTMLVGPMLVGGLRPSVGVGYSYCPSVVGFELEYLGTLGGETRAIPLPGASLEASSFNR
jgi:hypothetical protein